MHSDRELTTGREYVPTSYVLAPNWKSSEAKPFDLVIKSRLIPPADLGAKFPSQRGVFTHFFTFWGRDTLPPLYYPLVEAYFMFPCKNLYFVCTQPWFVQVVWWASTGAKAGTERGAAREADEQGSTSYFVLVATTISLAVIPHQSTLPDHSPVSQG